jgi:hypothetical protein
VLLAACDRLIAADRASAALAVWNGLSERHRIPYTIVRPETGHSLTAGDFHALPMSRGFDWRLPGPDGVTTLLEEHPRGMHFTFSGRQPESCEILTQYVPVLEDSSYELRYRYRTAGIAPGTGLEWRITNLKGTAVLAHGASLASESETIGQVRFKNPAGSPLVYLSLLYQRASGTTRIEGSITLRQVELIPAREQQP